MKICVECNKPMDILEIRSVEMDAYKDVNKRLVPPQLMDLIILQCKTCEETKRAYELMPKEYNYLMANSGRANYIGDF